MRVRRICLRHKIHQPSVLCEWDEEAPVVGPYIPAIDIPVEDTLRAQAWQISFLTTTYHPILCASRSMYKLTPKH